MIKKAVFILILFIGQLSLAQYDMDKNDDTTATPSNFNRQNILGRTYVGGELAMQFGVFTRLYMAPMIGYDITRSFSGGVSTMYQLFRQRFSSGAVINSHSYGGGLFLRYRPLPMIILQAEGNLYNTEDFTTPFDDRTNVPVFMLGAGYAGDFGGRAYYQAMISYDFVRDPNMPLPPLILFGAPFYLKVGMVFYLADRPF